MRNRAALSAVAASVAAIAIVGVYLTLAGRARTARRCRMRARACRGRALFRGAGAHAKVAVEFSSGTRFEARAAARERREHGGRGARLGQSGRDIGARTARVAAASPPAA